MSWDQSIGDPVVLPNGRKLTTLRQAAHYLRRLPKDEHEHPKVRTAIEVLIQAAEGIGPVMHARIGMLQAINRHSPPVEPRGISRPFRRARR